jgi:hypothetical protein
VQDQGVPLPPQANPHEPLTDGIGLRRVAGWVRRSCRAVLADVEPVDSGSLEVLLYCTDDLAVADEVPSRTVGRVVDR